MEVFGFFRSFWSHHVESAIRVRSLVFNCSGEVFSFPGPTCSSSLKIHEIILSSSPYFLTCTIPPSNPPLVNTIPTWPDSILSLTLYHGCLNTIKPVLNPLAAPEVNRSFLGMAQADGPVPFPLIQRDRAKISQLVLNGIRVLRWRFWIFFLPLKLTILDMRVHF